MKPELSNDYLATIANWIVNLTAQQIPERVKDKVRYQYLNVLASQHAAKHHTGALQAKRTVLEWGQTGKCTVLPSGEKLNLHNAVMINAINSMALDYDDYLYMGHTGHSAIVASWALCEELDLPASDLVMLAVIGNEIGGRLGITTALGPQNGQAWSYIHNMSAAAIAAKAYQLDANQTAQALAISLYQPGFTLWPGFMGADSKLLTAAWPTVQGIQAAQFAKNGMTGAKDILDHPGKGFWRFFTYAHLPGMLSGLGKSWLSDTLTFKKYPGCAYIDTALDALFGNLQAYTNKHNAPLDIQQIESISVTANLLTIEMDNLSQEYWSENQIPQTTTNFSIPLNIAIALLAGRLTGSELNQSYLDTHKAELLKLADKVHLQHDWDMTFSVVESVNDCLGEQSLSASLTLKQWRHVMRGYKGQLGGQRKVGLNVARITKSWRGLIQLILNKPKAPTQLNLGNVDFSKFKMSFPAKVAIHLKDGTIFNHQQDIPYGAQAQKDYFQTVIEKYFIEAGDDEQHMDVIRQITNRDLLDSINIHALTHKVILKDQEIVAMISPLPA